MEIEPQFYKVHTQSPDEIMHLIVPYLNFLGGFGNSEFIYQLLTCTILLNYFRALEPTHV